MKNPVIIFYVLFIALSNSLFCQDVEKSDYELLILEIDIMRSYSQFSEQVNALVDSAKEYARKEEYDFAIVFLEEAKNGVLVTPKIAKQQVKGPATKTLFFNLNSGLDYNRQEFELGFEQSDSVLLDELNKPFIGFDLKYLSADKRFQVENQLKYDKENLQNEFFLRNEFQNSFLNLSTKIGTVYDKNFVYTDLGYLELFTDVSLKSSDLNSDWYWNIKNLVRYKKFKQATQSIPNFVRNTFSTYIVKNFSLYKNIQFDYNFDFNESLKYLNNDFSEHDAGMSYQDVFLKRLKFKGSARSRISDFNYLLQDELGDSSFTNTSNTFVINPNIIYNFSSKFSLDLNYKVDFKKYDVKTEQEPDYTLHYTNPTIIFNLTEMISFKMGYVFEKKSHKTESSLQEQYIKDQNYSSRGFSAGFDYTSFSGIIVSLNAEYMLRRYPNVQDGVTFSLYSNRNILNLLLFTQLPISDNISINAIGSYDNDKDIDSDFNDSISSFYTFEISYSF